MGDFFKKNWLELSIFSLIFLILAFFASKTFLFYDDVTFGFQAITKDYFNFYRNYINNYGFFRPLALIYYFFIYEFFQILPRQTHLIPLAILVVITTFIFKTLFQQGLSKKQSLIVSLLFITLPIITETYSWLSANTSIIVLFIFFLQIYFVEQDFFKKNLIKFLLTLQTISVFFYESTIFMSIAIAYLLYVKGILKNKLLLVLFSISPILIYLISKLVVKPQFENRSQFITIPDAVSHWNAFLSQLKMLFSINYFDEFWKLEFFNGLNLIKNSYLITALFLTLFIFITYRLFKKDIEVKKNDIKQYLYFWLLTVFLSLIPLSWQTDYLPFRTLILPSLAIFILFLFIFKTITNNLSANKYFEIFSSLFKLFFILIIFAFMTIQISMGNQYINQFNIDKKIVIEINKKLIESGFENSNRSYLYLTNFFKNNVGRLTYGDYIHGMFFNYWSAEALLDLNSGSFAKVAIEFPLDKNFSSSLSREDFLKLRPLTIMSFTDNESCLNGECLKVEAVYQKPY